MVLSDKCIKWHRNERQCGGTHFVFDHDRARKRAMSERASVCCVCNSQFKCEKAIKCESRMDANSLLLLFSTSAYACTRAPCSKRRGCFVFKRWAEKVIFDFKYSCRCGRIRLNWILRNKIQSVVWTDAPQYYFVLFCFEMAHKAGKIIYPFDAYCMWS